MGKCLAYTGVAIVSLLIGAVATGVGVYYLTYDNTEIEPLKAQCILISTAGNSVSGTITLEQESPDETIYINGNVTGLSEGKHGFHIHQFGSTNGDCTMAAGHYNPEGMNHGGPDSDVRHVGDLGNIVSEGPTVGTIIKIEDNLVSLFGVQSVFGRSVMIHEGEDDLLPDSATGNAGSRLACCTIMHYK